MISQDEPCTAAQCVAICRLCMRLDIKEPLEQRMMSRGEAGRLVRELAMQAREKRRKYGYRNSKAQAKRV